MEMKTNENYWLFFMPDSDNDHKRIVIAQKVKTPTYRWSHNSH